MTKILFLLFGMLVQASALAVTFSWDASAPTATCTVAKYRLMWGDAAGGPYTTGSVETAGPTVLSLTVTGLTPGKRQYFVAKALGSPDGCDSANSNEVAYTEIVPLPAPGTLKISLPTAELTGAKWPAVALGSSETRSVTVRNIDGAPLRILQAQTEPPFALVRAPSEIPPGQSGAFRVAFTPTGPGFVSAPLALATSSGNLIVHLTGNAR